MLLKYLKFDQYDVNIPCNVRPTEEFIILALSNIFTDDHQKKILDIAIGIVVDAGIPYFEGCGGKSNSCKDGDVHLDIGWLYENSN